MGAEVAAARPPAVMVADSVTRLGAQHVDAVLVAGSHGGLYPAFVAAKAGLRAIVLNDAGVGKEQAGIAALAYLERLGMAAAVIGHMSARIGDGADMLARGRISHANAPAQLVGVRPGLRCDEAAQLLISAPLPTGVPPSYEEARFPLREGGGEPAVWGLDSNALAGSQDRGRILVTGSHGGLLGGRPETALKADALAAVYNDAGVGADEAGVTRLPALAARGIAAATVDCQTARIGDARSTWETGIVSHVNDVAVGLGARVGMRVQDFTALVIARSGQLR